MPELSIRAETATWSQNTDGVWTWYPQPDGVRSIYDPLADDGMIRQFGAFHEAGHTVTALTCGLGVDGVQLAPSSEGHMFHTAVSGTVTDWIGYAAHLAAGERSSDRWLRETGIWTPERAWAAERGASSDRAKAVSIATRTGQAFDFLSHPWDGWTQICSAADGALRANWGRVTAVATALLADGELNASAVARITGLPNQSAP